MIDTIEPALTKEAWATLSEPHRLKAFVDLSLATGYGHQIGLPGTMALANAALPEGHPNKITRDILFDIGWVRRMLRDHIQALRADGLPSSLELADGEQEMYDRLGTHIARLDALLPPEGT